VSENEAPERDIDVVIRRVKQEVPEVEVNQLKVKWPADDDNLWWFDLPEAKATIHIEGPRRPFLIETDEQSSKQALKATTIDGAVEMIVSYLRSVKSGCPIRLAGESYW